MLYILTGPIQSGKTRWLQAAIDALQDRETICEGVIAPGIWKSSNEMLVKEGITNELLPSREKVIFAHKANKTKGISANLNCSDKPSAESGWHIYQNAINKVNDHFIQLRRNAGITPRGNKRVLIIDELGVLEVMRNEGLVEAMNLLELGPQDYYAHAIVVVREKGNLARKVQEMYGKSWGGCKLITPNTYTPSAWVKSLI